LLGSVRPLLLYSRATCSRRPAHTSVQHSSKFPPCGTAIPCRRFALHRARLARLVFQSRDLSTSSAASQQRPWWSRLRAHRCRHGIHETVRRGQRQGAWTVLFFAAYIRRAIPASPANSVFLRSLLWGDRTALRSSPHHSWEFQIVSGTPATLLHSVFSAGA